MHLKMTVGTSVLWKIFMYLTIKWPQIVIKGTLQNVISFLAKQTLITGTLIDSQCSTTSDSLDKNAKCIFPWKFKGILRQECITETDPDDRQSHYREVARWEIFIDQELRFGLDLGWLGNYWGCFFHVFMGKKKF